MHQSTLAPVVRASLEKLGVVYTVFPCDPALADTAAFCERYHFSLNQSANTIIVATKTNPVSYACCVVLATTRLDVNKRVCELLQVKRASFADIQQTRDVTSMEIGGVTLFGLPPLLPVFIDSAVMNNTQIVLGGGNRKSKILLHPAELKKLPGIHIIENLAKRKMEPTEKKS